jgi:ethanolamine utilization cobalamin adenosyltransferase
MTQDEIIAMAQECNLIGMRPHLDGIYQEALERFALLIAAKYEQKIQDLEDLIKEIQERQA